MPTKLLIVDDHEMVRRGIAEMVDTADVQVVAEAADGDAGVTAARRHKPDVVLLDVRMDGQDGIDAIKRIRSAAPTARVVMLSAFDNSTYVARAVSAGAHDYVLKTATRKELLEAISGAAKNAAPSRSGEFRRVAGAMAKREAPTTTDVPLTPTGVAQAQQPGGLLHHAFSVRTLALFDRAGGPALASRLSGLLIGEELRAQALPAAAPVTVLASPALAPRYQRALVQCGHPVHLAPADATWLGLLAVARAAGLCGNTAAGTLAR